MGGWEGQVVVRLIDFGGFKPRTRGLHRTRCFYYAVYDIRDDVFDGVALSSQLCSSPPSVFPVTLMQTIAMADECSSRMALSLQELQTGQTAYV